MSTARPSEPGVAPSPPRVGEGERGGLAPTRTRGSARWWTYQRERFPLASHLPLVAAFSSSAVCYVWLLGVAGGAGGVQAPSLETAPAPARFLVAGLCCLLFFLQLRIADEFKDFAEDTAHRPYRPVPRGLVTLRELGVVFVLAGAAQAAMTIWLAPRLLILLAAAWAYLGLMSREFFVGGWLRRRPAAYMFSHMLIMPLIDFYATGAQWMTTTPESPPVAGLAAFLGMSYCNGLVFEIGRKIRRPADEEPGVGTYSALWGRRRAVLAWVAALAASGACAVAAARLIGFTFLLVVVVAAALLAAAAAGIGFLRAAQAPSGKRFEIVSGLWMIAAYISLGVAPALWVILGERA